MNIRSGLSLLLLATTFQALAGASDLAESEGDFRFDIHATNTGFSLVVRGKPHQPVSMLTEALVVRAKAICAGAVIDGPPKPSEYEYLEGGAQFLMPVGGAFVPMTSYSTPRMASSVTGTVVCSRDETTLAEPHLRIYIDSRVGETIAYIDQGFASFNRERLDVQVSGATFKHVIADAVRQALSARGYAVDIVDSADSPAARITVGKAPVPGERFEGIAMLTKIGLLGIQNLSAAFCSIEIAIRTSDEGEPKAIGGVSTRELIPAIYRSWKQDMVNGPSERMQSETSALLARTLSRNVRASIHAMPAGTIRSLWAAPVE